MHRPSYLDYVGVKQFAPDGTVVGERRFLGLYTTTAYKRARARSRCCATRSSACSSPAAFPPDSHDAKGLIDILESLPRDLLVQIDVDDLFDIAIGILGLGERQRVRLFVTATSSIGSSPARCACRGTASTPRTACGRGGSWPRRSAAPRSTGACSCPNR